MSCQKRRSRKADIKNNTKIEDYFLQVPREPQNGTNISQTKAGSRKRVRDITNTQDQGCPFPKKIPDNQTMHLKKVINIILDVNHRKNQNMKYVLQESERVTLYKALSTLKAVKEEEKSQPGKEMLVCGTEGIEGFLNLGMPLNCFPDESSVRITFSKHVSEQENHVFGRHDRTSTDCIKFYIHAIGKTKKQIVKCRELHKEGNKLCVFGFKGETVKDALCKDGRFLPFLENDPWKLIRNLKYIIESSQVVDKLEGDLFQIEVENRRSSRVAAMPGAAQNSELENSNFRVLKEYIVEEYPTLKREMEKIRENFKKEMKTEKKQRTALIRLHKANFGKQTRNSTPVKIIKLLSRLSESVGFLHWNNNGNEGSATCFVFAKSLILTCRHVIHDIVGSGVEPSGWAAIIGQCAWVTFSYEEFETKDHDRFCIEPRFEVSDVNLDYAVLKLKENGQQVPAGLYNGIGPIPPNGVVYIIGHPDGKMKSTDACVVIPQSERTQTSHRNFRTSVPEPDCEPRFLHMYTQKSFQEILHNPNIVTYDTTFYWGSSGSPVFDSQGSLVAMHTAGITDQYLGGNLHIIEFGSAMESILSDMKQNHKEWFEQEVVNQQDVEMPSQEY
ncbi:PREDICTED: protein FAM111A [Chinchilla lanigera]|uniref:FAM111 trypsin like peptidase A n=1 Tax=Chinchilla lanigera TaxID=34839 RepID=A0A8C2US73_CHILA|nr:PREDICTED: protein FAM111A [Chinchilla lanigera]